MPSLVTKRYVSAAPRNIAAKTRGQSAPIDAWRHRRAEASSPGELHEARSYLGVPCRNPQPDRGHPGVGLVPKRLRHDAPRYLLWSVIGWLFRGHLLPFPLGHRPERKHGLADRECDTNRTEQFWLFAHCDRSLRQRRNAQRGDLSLLTHALRCRSSAPAAPHLDHRQSKSRGSAHVQTCYCRCPECRHGLDGIERRGISSICLACGIERQHHPGSRRLRPGMASRALGRLPA
jgi:hypothetical protein